MEQRIPSQYVGIVKKALIAAAGLAPLGVMGGLDTAGIAAVWTTMFLAIRKKGGSQIGVDPKKICLGVATGIARYYLGCKAATYLFFLVPGLGPFVAVATAIGISGICNIYFTYSFAAALITLFSKDSIQDDDIIRSFVRSLQKLPNTEEVKEIVSIYQSNPTE